MKEGKGFITVAAPTLDINYVENARILAKSIKATQHKVNNISLIAHKDYVTEDDYSLFDKITIFDAPVTESKNFNPESLVYDGSPYKQTIKIEADMLLTASIDHWWDIVDEKDIMLTNKVMTYDNKIIYNRACRKVFDDNNLPDVYSGIYYFRHSKTSFNFFRLVNAIFIDWEWYRDNYLKKCNYKFARTDEVFAIAAILMGEENVIHPELSIPTFVHMKNELQGLPKDEKWYDYLDFEIDSDMTRIGFFAQKFPLHYVDKEFVRDRSRFIS